MTKYDLTLTLAEGKTEKGERGVYYWKVLP